MKQKDMTEIKKVDADGLQTVVLKNGSVHAI